MPYLHVALQQIQEVSAAKQNPIFFLHLATPRVSRD
jgi:hypothetical protein